MVHQIVMMTITYRKIYDDLENQWKWVDLNPLPHDWEDDELTAKHHIKYFWLWSSFGEWRICFSMVVGNSVTRLGDLLDFGPLFKAFGNN